MNAIFAGAAGFVDTWEADTHKVVLVDHAVHVPDPVADANLEDIPAGARVGTSESLTGKTVASGVAQAANLSVAGIAAGSTAHSLIVYKDSGDEATSTLLVFIDEAPSLPIFTNGSNVDITWGAPGIGSETEAHKPAVWMEKRRAPAWHWTQLADRKPQARTSPPRQRPRRRKKVVPGAAGEGATPLEPVEVAGSARAWFRSIVGSAVTPQISLPEMGSPHMYELPDLPGQAHYTLEESERDLKQELQGRELWYW